MNYHNYKNVSFTKVYWVRDRYSAFNVFNSLKKNKLRKNNILVCLLLFIV